MYVHPPHSFSLRDPTERLVTLILCRFAGVCATMGDKSRDSALRKTASKDFSKLRSFKITAVGDGMVGKTCLLFTYVHKQFPTEYVPTV